MLSTNEHAITMDRALIYNRVAYIYTYPVYMMIGRVVSLNRANSAAQVSTTETNADLLKTNVLCTNRQQTSSNLRGITLGGLQSVNQLTVYS